MYLEQNLQHQGGMGKEPMVMYYYYEFVYAKYLYICEVLTSNGD
jgi:hypothetical protein